ncbi:hypothetical protein [Streptomyces sp. NPDC090445]|uniref:hypothetical protein n=1 Tax=Streptomyces sp. NPDC090445 TaxID=3365963 RepID=UPI003805EFF3
MKRVLAALAVTGMALSGTALTATAASAQGTGAAGCWNWTAPSSIGQANGTVCDGHVSGYVKDTKADGKCPFVRFEFNNGGVEDSPWVGPKGAQKSFSLNNGSGPKKWYMMHVPC